MRCTPRVRGNARARRLRRGTSISRLSDQAPEFGPSGSRMPRSRASMRRSRSISSLALRSLSCSSLRETRHRWSAPLQRSSMFPEALPASSGPCSPTTVTPETRQVRCLIAPGPFGTVPGFGGPLTDADVRFAGLRPAGQLAGFEAAATPRSRRPRAASARGAVQDVGPVGQAPPRCMTASLTPRQRRVERAREHGAHATRYGDASSPSTGMRRR